MPYNGQPHKCDCFGGRCYRQFCPEKLVAKAQKAPAATATATPSARPRGAILAWRWDGSHENGPVPEGRLPRRAE